VLLSNGRSGAWRSAIVASAIISAHGAIAMLMLWDSAHPRFDPEPVAPMVANIIEPQPTSLLSLNPDLAPAERVVILGMPVLPTDSESTMPSVQSPVIDPEIHLDVSAYSARAELTPGAVTTVILLLEVGPDGSVRTAKVMRGGPNEKALEAAVEYAMATRWIPGRIDGEPRAMQASLTVVLGERI
jgi:hypothetical protein